MRDLRLLCAVLLVAPLLLLAQVNPQPAGQATVSPGAIEEKTLEKPKTPGLELKQVVAKLEANVGQISTLQSKFSQEVRSQQFGKTLSSGGGELFFAKPGKMTWHYTAPEEHWYITDGKVFWDYLPSAKQAMMVKLDEALASNLPKSFLFGMGKLSEQFSVQFHPDQSESDPKVYHLILTPKKEQDKVMIGILELVIDSKSFLVQQARLKDPMGNESIMTFSQMKVNPRVDEKIFQFAPPPGVEVIKPQAEAAQKKPSGAKTGAKAGEKTKSTGQKGAEKK
jgi:outer membrane lipoprotein carrier protein